MKIVINRCFGGFGLSPAANLLYAKRKGHDLTFYLQTRYRFGRGVDEYTRVDTPPNESFLSALTADLGPVIHELPGDLYWYPEIERSDPDLIAVIEEIGASASSGSLSNLAIVEIPDGVEWEIEDYDGSESIHEKHRSW